MALGLVCGPPAAGAVDFAALAVLRTGTPEPGGSNGEPSFGSFVGFFDTRVNDAGQILFVAFSRDGIPPTTQGFGVYLRDTDGSIRTIARSQQLEFSELSLNAAGQVSLRIGSGPTSRAVFDGGSGLATLVSAGNVLPPSSNEPGEPVGDFGPPVLDDAGRTALLAKQGVDLFRFLPGDDLGAAANVLDLGLPIRGPAGETVQPTDAAAALAGSPGGGLVLVARFDTLQVNLTGLFLFDPTINFPLPPFRRIVQGGDRLPGDDGIFALFRDNSSPRINDNGEVAFLAAINPDVGALTTALFTAPPLRQILRLGDAAPDVDGLPAGTFDGIPQDYAFNARRSLVLRGNLSVGTSGLFYADAAGTIQAIARQGDPLLNGLATFARFREFSLSDDDHVVFTADLQTGSGEIDALFRWTPADLPAPLAREGEVFDAGFGLLAIEGIEQPAQPPGGDERFVANLLFANGRQALIFAQAGDAPVAPTAVNHYLLYKVKTTRRTPKLAKFGPVVLEDQFRSARYNVVSSKGLGLPAEKNGEPVLDDVTHLQEYQVKPVKGDAKFAGLTDVTITNQCNDLLIKVGKPLTLLVPTNKSLTDPAPFPVDAEHAVDHFLCYQAKPQKKRADGTRLAKFPKGIQVEVVDQFQARRYDLKKIVKLCNPVAKSGTPRFLSGPAKGTLKPITPAAVENEDGHLVCYQAKLATKHKAQTGCGPADPADKGTPIKPKQDKHVKRVGVHVANQLGRAQLDTIKELELCIPSRKTLPAP